MSVRNKHSASISARVALASSMLLGSLSVEAARAQALKDVMGSVRPFERGQILIPKDWSNNRDLEKFRDLKNAVDRRGTSVIEAAPASPSGPQQADSPSTSPAINASVPASVDPAPASSLDAGRLTARAERIDAAVRAEMSSSRSVLTEFVKRFEDLGIASVSIPEEGRTVLNAGRSVPVERELSARGGTLESTVAVAAAIERARAEGIKVSESDLKTLPLTEIEQQTSRNPAALTDVLGQYGRAISAYETLLKSPAAPSALNDFQREAGDVRSTVVENWKKIAPDLQARQAAVRVYDALAVQPELKAIYGVSTNFSPPSYRQVYHNSRRTVGIRSGAPNFCSGVALDHQWILTAGHCFIRDAWPNVEVSFAKDGFASSTRNAIVKGQWPSPAPGQAESDQVDYSFIRIEDAEVSSIVKALDGEASQALPGLLPEVKPMCIRSSPVRFREPIFVIAHQGPEKKVYDYAYVIFPHLVSGSEFERVEAENGIRLTRAAERWREGDDAKRVFIANGEKMFKSLYRKFAALGMPDRYEFRRSGLSFSGERPFFGLDSDTFQGNSGGPVFSRVDTCIVGVFSAGARDGFEANEATIKDHEYATPISAVLSDIRAQGERLDQLAAAGTPVDVIARRRELLKTLDRLEGR